MLRYLQVFPIFLSLCALFFFSCTKDATPVESHEEQIWPMELLQSWEYVLNDQLDSVKFRITVTAVSRTSPEPVYVISIWEYPDYEEMQYLAPGEDGVYMRVMDQLFLYLKYPVKVGEEWNAPGSEGVTIRCVSLNSSVSTPYGDFSCIVYQFSDVSAEISWEYYMAPDVGPVAFHLPSGDWYRLKHIGDHLKTQ